MRCGRGDDGGAAEAVAHKHIGGAARLRHGARRSLQVLDIAAEGGVGEVALAFAKAREVEPQDVEASRRERAGDPDGGQGGLAAGEAVGEQHRPTAPPERPARTDPTALGPPSRRKSKRSVIPEGWVAGRPGIS